MYMYTYKLLEPELRNVHVGNVVIKLIEAVSWDTSSGLASHYTGQQKVCKHNRSVKTSQEGKEVLGELWYKKKTGYEQLIPTDTTFHHVTTYTVQ